MNETIVLCVVAFLVGGWMGFYVAVKLLKLAVTQEMQKFESLLRKQNSPKSNQRTMWGD